MVKGLLQDDGKWYFTNDNGEMVMEPVTLEPDDNGALQYPGLDE